MKRFIKPEGCTNLKLRQLNRMVTRHYDHFVAQVGLKNTQYALLSHVVRLGPIRPADLAKHMQLDASTLTRNLQSLTAQGWVTINAGENARSRLVIATESGHEKRIEGQRAWLAAQEALNERLGIERVAELHTLLDSCIQSLDDEPSLP
ncbi:MarR family winged helix-turn-helix transcriptional regulator [Erwiniaceae bacterium BAC15a-03b]|uniref:MarR family winged helix-turn-helix transcriptional regulator n=1 Tax=Winslowiella arboricola TaxID=2978220 RepID=A0A9J6PKZ9_9GAMM|nr:MarR family winged helix-turn-helix transcriptional regulator [Winslowiella arboricola]MCU5774446.1 MarR family winged helix-turn-helix transcriptional regulator [Winslowiella arboricola]MCU5778993.1 MarR family winged helix-turn-helix transcriptional regulator [Winslowiella arboricola]